ncbi:MAG: type II secretion system protein [Leptothrix ochracea]|uniref:type II secretion system protein n=1 Tax=Leptothrix ochracea TaxID=735331 RepID=UPI0034E20CB9
MKSGDAFRLRWQRGFTMIELIVVMTVIGLLLSLAMPRYFQALERGKRQIQQQDLALMREAIDKYYGDNARYPDQLEDLVTRRYLRAIPIDPLTEKMDWTVLPPPDAGKGNVFDVRSAAATPEDSFGAGVPGLSPAASE